MSMQSVTASSHPTLSYTDSLAASTSDTLLLIARILMGWIFVRSGLGKLMDINAFIATMTSHRYWEFAEAAARRAQDSNFYKNLAIMGGLVFAFVTAGGRFSIDRLLARK